MHRAARFGDFEWHASSGELRRRAAVTRLQPQPARVLSLLIERAGEVVTRDEIQREVWPTDTFVDFEQGLYFCIRYLRCVLGETANAPRHIETLPKRGYRFLGLITDAPATTQAAGRLRLAIQRFATLGAIDDYIVDGLTAEMITEASRIAPRRLAVISATSVLRPPPGIGSLSDALGVDYVLEGTIRRAGDRLRVTARLIDTHERAHLWSDAFEDNLSAALDIQKQVAHRISAALTLELLPVATDLAISPIAHDAYLRGRFEFTRFTEGALRRSLVWYERALGIAPDYALAHAGLADAYIQLGQSRAGFMAPREAMPRARAAATRALELDASLSDAHAALAECLMWYDWKWTEAEDAFRTAIDLNPSNSRARLWYALLLSYRQRGGEAIAEIERARELDPFSPLVNTYVGVVEYLGGDVERAVAALDRTLADDPTYHWAHYFRGVVLRHAGRYQDAIAAFEEAIRLAPDAASPLAHLGHTLCLSGQASRARLILDDLARMASTKWVCPALFALVHIGLGELDVAIECIRRALEDRSGSMVLLTVEPSYRLLHAHPAFPPIASAVGLP
jgi:TolB-like protein/Tfp pilus assembly protein PilF